MERNNNKNTINGNNIILRKPIREWTSEELLHAVGNTLEESACNCRCSVNTFRKYYKAAMEAAAMEAIRKYPQPNTQLFETVSMEVPTNRIISKSTSSDIFLDPGQSKVAVADIEASGLRGDFGVILCCAIKDYGRDKIALFAIDLDAKDLLESEKQMLLRIKYYLEDYDGIITYFGSRYDIPMLRTRMLYHGISPIPKLKSLDVYFTVKRVVNTTSRRLERVSDLMRINANKELPEKTKIDINEWIRVLHSRDKQSLKYITEHCIADVVILEGVTNELREFLPERIMRA